MTATDAAGAAVVQDATPGLAADARRALLRHMLVARAVDEEAIRLQRQGALDLWPSCQGQEAAQVGTALATAPHDMVVPSYREHAVVLARGVPAHELLAQWAGRTFCGWDPLRHRVFPYTLVLAAQTLHAVGFSLGERLQGRPDVVVVYIGDGATSEGDMSEALNLAAVEHAAVVFVCQNNGWAISTPTSHQMRTSPAERARGFGVTARTVTGRDPETVLAAAGRAVAHARHGRGPYLLELRVDRVHGHSTSDAQELYREPADIERAATLDPVPAYLQRLRAERVVDDAWLGEVDAHLRAVRERLVREFAP